MTKYERFQKEELNFLQNMNRSKNLIMELIGDSPNTSRSLSMNQVIRALANSTIPIRHKLISNITAAFEIIKPSMLDYRKNNNKRTDAYDIGEFIATFDQLLSSKSFKLDLSRKLIY